MESIFRFQSIEQLKCPYLYSSAYGSNINAWLSTIVKKKRIYIMWVLYQLRRKDKSLANQ